MGINKNAKGTVAVSKYRNTIRLRWRYAGKRYCLSLFTYTKKNLVQAKKVAVSIEDDLVTGAFDFTLAKYKATSNTHAEASLVQQFELWASTYRNKDCNVDWHYNTVRNMLKRWGAIQPVHILDKLTKEQIAPRTYNQRLRMLSAFMDFLLAKGEVQANVLKSVKARKVDTRKKEDRKPFTEQEISQILEAFRTDSCCKCTNYRHSFYFPFVYFIFQTGVRNAEAIGLRVKHIDFENKVVEIKEALARSVKGTNAAVRIRKSTKNGKERRLPMNDELMTILKPQVLGKKPDDLVFISPRGLAIDDQQFQKRVFKKVLEGLQIPVRVLYAARHTFGSRCIHEGLTPVMTAFLMGNNPETALRNYVHLMELPNLPSIVGKKGNP